ncbi:unnamed protein product, partial [Polarella glacialis]
VDRWMSNSRMDENEPFALMTSCSSVARPSFTYLSESEASRQASGGHSFDSHNMPLWLEDEVEDQVCTDVTDNRPKALSTARRHGAGTPAGVHIL